MNLVIAMPRLASNAATIALVPPEVLMSAVSLSLRSGALVGYDRSCASRLFPMATPPTHIRTPFAPSATIVFMPSQHGGPTVAPMADLFEEYPFGRAWDEMFSAPGQIRPAYESVFARVADAGCRRSQGARRHHGPDVP